MEAALRQVREERRAPERKHKDKVTCHIVHLYQQSMESDSLIFNVIIFLSFLQKGIMFEIRLEDGETKDEEVTEKEEEEMVSDERQEILLLLLFLFLFFLTLSSTCPTGLRPSEPDSELPGGGGAEAQGLVGGEEGVESEESSDSAGRFSQHGRHLGER